MTPFQLDSIINVTDDSKPRRDVSPATKLKKRQELTGHTVAAEEDLGIRLYDGEFDQLESF